VKPTPVNQRNWHIDIQACKNITEKSEFVENVLPNSAMFIYVSTNCVQALSIY